MLSSWSKNDIEAYRQFDEQISKKASWNVTSTELVQIYKSFVWFASLKDKIDKSQAEIKSVKQYDEVKAEAEKEVKKARKPRTVTPAGE